MTLAAAHAQKFYQQVAAERRVFTIVNQDSLIVLKVNGIEVVPFWSSRSRLDRVQNAHPKYQAYQAEEILLDSFLAKTLPQLLEEQIHVGINWSGKRLAGYDLTVDDLERNLQVWLAKHVS